MTHSAMLVGVVAYTFKVLAYHQHIQCKTAHIRFPDNYIHQALFYLFKIVIHHVVMGYDVFASSRSCFTYASTLSVTICMTERAMELKSSVSFWELPCI